MNADNFEDGYILTPRSWDKSKAAHWPPLTRELWFWLLRNVSYRDYKTLHRGEGFFTLNEISEGLSWKSGYCNCAYSKSQLSRALQKLQDEGALQKWKSTRGVRVKITNYDAYQNPENYRGGAGPTGATTHATNNATQMSQVTIYNKNTCSNSNECARNGSCDNASDASTNIDEISPKNASNAVGTAATACATQSSVVTQANYGTCDRVKTDAHGLACNDAAPTTDTTHATTTAHATDENKNTCDNANNHTSNGACKTNADVGDMSPKKAGNAAEMTVETGGRLGGDDQADGDACAPVTYNNNSTYITTLPVEGSYESWYACNTGCNAYATTFTTKTTPISAYNYNAYDFQNREVKTDCNARYADDRHTIDKNYKNYNNNNKKEETPKNNTSDILDAEPEPENTNATAAAVTSNLPRAFLDSPFRDESERFAAWFNRELKPQGIRGTQKELSDWALVWYHLRQTDNRDNVAEMGEAIRWARNDPFWSANFQTPNKLRRRDKDGMMYIDRFIALYKRQKNGITNGKTRKNGRLGDQMPVDAEGLREIAERIANNPRLSH